MVGIAAADTGVGTGAAAAAIVASDKARHQTSEAIPGGVEETAANGFGSCDPEQEVMSFGQVFCCYSLEGKSATLLLHHATTTVVADGEQLAGCCRGCRRQKTVQARCWTGSS